MKNDITKLRYFNTPSEPIHLTGLPLELIPKDTPTYLTDLTYNLIMESLACGIPLTKTLRSIGCKPIVYGRILRWLYKDDKRRKEYHQAMEIGSEILASEILEIADGQDLKTSLPEDLGRSALRINVRKHLMGIQNKDRFGAKVEQTVNINLVDAMRSADKRIDIIEGEVIE